MGSGDSKVGTYWPDSKDEDCPDGCQPCPLCNGMCMVAESVEPDWHGRGKVIRIMSYCDHVLEYPNDHWRTEFNTPEEAVKEWNNFVRKQNVIPT